MHRDLPDLTIAKGDRDMAITYAKIQSTTVAKVVNKLMEGCFTQKYMATHSVSGGAPRKSKGGSAAAAEPVPTKPGMKEDHISALFSELKNLFNYLKTKNIVIVV